MTNRYALFQSADAPMIPIGVTDSAGAVPVRRFRKDIARVGRFTHPVEKWTLDITPERMGKWAASFRAMKADGVPVEVNVDHSIKAEDARGQIVDMFVDADRLIAIHEMRGDEAIRLAEHSLSVSPLVVLDYKAGNGKSYGEAITHSAIVQQPVITGQKPFEAMAASMNANSLYFSTGDDMKLDTLRTLLGAKADVPDEALQSMVAEKLREAESKATAAKNDAAAKVSEIDQLKAKIADLEKNKATPKAEPDQDTLGMLAEGAEAAMEGLVMAGSITPNVAKKITAAYIGEKGKRNAFALSAAYSGRDTSIVKELIEILRENKAVDMKPRTKPQVLSMSIGEVTDAEQNKKNADTVDKLFKAGAGIA